MKNSSKMIILSLVGILTLIFLSTQQESFTGKIQKIQYKENRIILCIENTSSEFIVFSERFLNIKNGDIIEIYGRKDNYRGKPQVIVDKIKQCS